jgi:hypothetical protein
MQYYHTLQNVSTQDERSLSLTYQFRCQRGQIGLYCLILFASLVLGIREIMPEFNRLRFSSPLKKSLNISFFNITEHKEFQFRPKLSIEAYMDPIWPRCKPPRDLT